MRSLWEDRLREEEEKEKEEKGEENERVLDKSIYLNKSIDK